MIRLGNKEDLWRFEEYVEIGKEFRDLRDFRDREKCRNLILLYSKASYIVLSLVQLLDGTSVKVCLAEVMCQLLNGSLVHVTYYVEFFA